MRTIVLILAVALFAMPVMGCGVGLIYTHTVTPLATDLHQTKVVPTDGTGNIKHIQVGQIGVAWDSVAFGDIAKKKGMNELSFADLETLKVIGIWNQYTVHLYGK